MKTKIKNNTFIITLTPENVKYINEILNREKYNFNTYEAAINAVINYSKEKTYYL